MSADTASDTKPAEKPLIPLLGVPADANDEARPASQCCGGGACSL